MSSYILHTSSWKVHPFWPSRRLSCCTCVHHGGESRSYTVQRHYRCMRVGKGMANLHVTSIHLSFIFWAPLTIVIVLCTFPHSSSHSLGWEKILLSRFDHLYFISRSLDMVKVAMRRMCLCRAQFCDRIWYVVKCSKVVFELLCIEL